MTARSVVYSALDAERDYQDWRWAGTSSDDKQSDKPALDRSIDEYTLYIQGYVNELVHIASHSGNSKDKLDVVRKVGALCVACMEQNGVVERKRS